MGFMPYAVSPLSHMSVSASIPSDSRSERREPITLKVSQNTRNITPKNTGSAVYFPVSILSIFTLRLCSRLSRHLTTDSETAFSINVYRISARAALRSRPVSCSISTTLCSISSRSFLSSSSLSAKYSSPSMSFVEQNLGGTEMFRA